jgi:predicted NAD/FAD-dependent oxidoreductase
MMPMGKERKECEILIIGAGMAGLTAAGMLRRAGRRVLVLDKGRGPGGRMASRRFGGATFDHGAQFMTAKDPRFAAAMAKWEEAKIVSVWYRRIAGEARDNPRWRGRPAMTAAPRHLARSVESRFETRVTLLEHNSGGWGAVLAGGDRVSAKAVLLTSPVPQTLALLDAGGIDLPAEMRQGLESIRYERCLAVMAVLDGTSGIPEPGGLVLNDGPIAWIADNHKKGISAVPAVTLHARADFSLENWDRDREESGRMLIDSAAPMLGSKVTACQVHGWRFSKPLRVEARPFLALKSSPPLLIAGDAFAGPRVEGAALSGRAAAEALNQMMPATR